MTIWRVPAPLCRFEWKGELEAYWEVYLDPISDEHTPEEISAEQLLELCFLV
jgi:hypothetical protein